MKMARRITTALFLLTLISLSCFGQTGSTKREPPQLTVIEGDTFAIVPIADLKLANGIFVKEGMYKMASDSLQSLVYVYKDKVAVKEAQITTLQENVANYKKVADLCDVEKASLQAALEKEKKDYKRYRLKTTIVGILGSVLLGIVTALAIR